MPNSFRRSVVIALATLVTGGVATALAVAFPGRLQSAEPSRLAELAESPFVPTTPKPTPTPTPTTAATRAATRPRAVPQPTTTRRPTPAPVVQPTPCDDFETECPETPEPDL